MDRLICCRVCGQVQRPPAGAEPVWRATLQCCRCGARFSGPARDSFRRTMALALAALILYVPANSYPILEMEWYGRHSENTIWEGCVQLFQHGQWPVAVIVFLASILVPLLKLLGLFYLAAAGRFIPGRRCRERAWICRALAAVGPWAMLDVFLVAVLVALVKLGEFATIVPGPGLLAFAAVVVLTLLASSALDPWQIWDESERPV